MSRRSRAASRSARRRDEITSSADLWEYAATLCRHTYGDTYNTLGPTMLGLVLREPVGVVGMITPWNFPLLIISQKLPFALAVGCTAVVKPAELTPGTTIRLAQIAQDAGLPDGVLNVVTGPGRSIGASPGRAPRRRHDQFHGLDGRRPAGHRRLEGQPQEGRARARRQEPAARLRGRRPRGGARRRRVRRLLQHGRVLQQRQPPARPALDRGRVHRARSSSARRTVPVGDPLDPATKVGAIASDEQFGKIMELVDAGRAEGADLLLGGDRLATDRGPLHRSRPCSRASSPRCGSRARRSSAPSSRS